MNVFQFTFIFLHLRIKKRLTSPIENLFYNRNAMINKKIKYFITNNKKKIVQKDDYYDKIFRENKLKKKYLKYQEKNMYNGTIFEYKRN